MASLWPSLILATWVSFATAQYYSADDPNNHFNYPPPLRAAAGDYSTAIQLPLGQQVQIIWNTNYSMVNLYLWQDKGAGETLSTNNTQQNFIWVATPAQKLADGDTFFFATYDSLNPTDSKTALFYSAYFNLTSPSASSSSASTSATSSSAPATTVVVTSTATASPTSSPASGGSHVGLGVGVGVGVGGALLLLAGAFWFFRKRQKKQQGNLTEVDHKLSERLNGSHPHDSTNGPFPRTELPAYQRNTGPASELET